MPADDLTDPAPATTFAHLDATTVLSRSIAELGEGPRLPASLLCLPCSARPATPPCLPSLAPPALLCRRPQHRLRPTAGFLQPRCPCQLPLPLPPPSCPCQLPLPPPSCPPPPLSAGIYPAVDPLDSTSRMLDPRILGERADLASGGGDLGRWPGRVG